MKTKRLLMLINALIIGLYAFSSCKKHAHEFASIYSYNSEAHWQTAICEHTTEKKNYGTHEYGEWTVIEVATHAKNGSKKRVCKVCGYENIVTIPSLGHSFSSEWKEDSTNHWHECSCGDKKDNETHKYEEFTIIKEATDSEDGSKKQVCSVCGYENVVKIPSLGHSYGTLSWEWDGYTSATASFTCENNTSHIEEVSATITSEDTIPATCTGSGVRTYTATVTFEGKTYTKEKTEEIPALGHSFTKYISNNDATSTQDGTKTAHCDFEGCNETNTIIDEGTKLGHVFGNPVWNWNGYEKATVTLKCQTCVAELNHTETSNATITSKVTTPATCEENGVRTYTATVTFGGITYTNEKTEEIPALGHSFTNYILDNNESCTKDGTKTAICDHEGCNEHNSIAIEGSKLNHDLIHVEAKEPTCTEVGWDAYDYCSRCDYSTYVEKPITHTYAAWIVDEEATCTTDGSKHRVCTICGNVETKVIDKFDHNLIHVDAKEPTCTQIGWEEYDYCSRGDYSTYEGIPAKGHTASEWIIDEAPTCTTDGKKHKECTVCHEILEEATIDKLGHDLEQHDAKAPTCTEKGWEAYDTCSRCDYSSYDEIPANGHTKSEWIIDEEATCTTNGTKHKECTVCNERLETEDIEALGHSFTNYVSNNDATSSKDGTMTAKCDHKGCNETNTIVDIGSMIGHEYNDPVWKWTGYSSSTASFTCINCEENTHIEVVNATITYAITTPATCESNGVRTYTAKVLFNGAEYINTKDEVIDAHGHEYTVKWLWSEYESATATFTCIHDKNHVEERVATGESIKNEITTPAKCLEDGERTYTATVILNGVEYTNTKIKALEATGHMLSDNTCTVCGYDAGGSKGLNMVLDNKTNTYSLNGIGTCSDTEIVIPAYYDGLPVTSIGNNAFNGCSSIASVTLPEGITSIGERAFAYCSSLASVSIGKGINEIKKETFISCGKLIDVVIPEGVTVIGDSAFMNCGAMTNIKLPNGVKKICKSAFEGMHNLVSINLPQGLEVIETNAFYNCDNLIKIEIPNTVTEMGTYIFYGCGNLSSANIPEKIIDIPTGTFVYCYKLKELKLHDKIKTIGFSAFFRCRALETIPFPKSLTSIASQAFYQCDSLVNISLPDSLVKIGEYAFYNCKNVKSISINKNLQFMDKYVFSECDELEEVVANGGVIGDYAFSECKKLNKLTLLEGFTKIGNYAFLNCTSIETIILPESIASIGENAFEGCTAIQYTEYDNAKYLSIGSNNLAILVKVMDQNITSFTINEATKVISDYAFEKCINLTSMTIPYTVTSIGKYAFSECTSLTQITIGKGVTSIGDYAFKDCRFESIIIPENVTSIGAGLFMNCINLKNLEIGDMVSYIGASAFEGCKALENLTLPDNLTEILDKTFKDCISLKNMTIHSRITRIGDYAFQNCTSLSNVSIGNGVTSIGSYAFNNCSLLKEVILPDSAGSINNCAFQNCTSLTSINIPNNATSINRYSFANCVSLESISIPNDVTLIDEGAFMNCSLIKEVLLPNSVQKIGMSSFANCSSIKNVSTGENLLDITRESFSNCVSLKSITIGNSVRTIGMSAFENCRLLTNIVIPNSVTTINGSSFHNCYSLLSITIGSGVNRIASDAFENCYHLVEVYNLSSLEITKGSANYGYVGYYAINIINSLEQESKLYTDENGFIFYNDTDTTYLVTNFKNETSFILPTLENDKTYVINSYAFIDRTDIKEIVIPNCITEIRKYAFSNCLSITSITIPASITTIENYAFYKCFRLVEVRNLSAFNMIKGQISFGYIAYYALVVNNSNETKLVDVDGYLFCSENETTYLIGYVGNEIELILPTLENEKNYEIRKNAFSQMSTIESVVIPSCVTGIGEYSFSYCTSLISVEIEDGITSIGDHVFEYCTSLKNIDFPASLNSIGEYTFDNCTSLTEIALDGCTINTNAFRGCTAISSLPLKNCTIGYYAFTKCNSLKNLQITECTVEKGAFANCAGLTNIIIDGGSIGDCSFSECPSLENINVNVISIGKKAFSSSLNTFDESYKNNNLKTLVLGEKLTSIGDYALYGCINFKELIIPENIKTIGNHAFGGWTSLESLTINCEEIGDYAFSSNNYKYQSKNLSSLTIGNCVKKIGSYAFANCPALTELTIPSNVEEIGSYCFYSCDGLTNLSSSANNIGESAFAYCRNLEEITIYSGSIGSKAFNGCSKLKNVTIESDVTSIGEQAFTSCTGLESVTIKGGEIGNYAFSSKTNIESYFNSSLREVIIGDKVTSIGNYAFQKCYSLESVTIANGLSSIGEYAFSNCTSLTSISIPNSVTSIKNSAFNKCLSLSQVNLPENITVIPSYAFSGCISLKKIVIPESVTTIEDCAFSNCYKLLEVYNLSNTLSIKIGAENNGKVGCYAAVVYDSLETPSKLKTYGDYVFYENETATYLVNYEGNETIITLPTLADNKKYEIHKYAFVNMQGQEKIESVVLSSSVIAIGDYAFYNCSSLKSIEIPESVTSIGNYAFFGCSSLESIEIPESVTSIGNYAFFDCSSLASIVIPEGITSIGMSTFYNCSSLISIEIPEGITSIGMSTFYNCSSLVSINLPDSLETIGSSAFYKCSSLTTITVPNKMKSIAASAFNSCESLVTVIIPKTVTSIELRAFYECDKLEEVYYCGTQEEWNNISIKADNAIIDNVTKIFYSETEPSLNDEGTAYDGHYWHYVDGEIVVWKKL